MSIAYLSIPGDGLHGNEIKDSLKCIFGTNGQLHDKRIGS